MDTSIPDSQELADEVAYSVRVMEIQEFGKDRLPAGPSVEDSDEIIIVEGRADVLNLLKHGIKNSIAINGTSVPESIVELCKKKIVTVFVDGDRGGDLIIKEFIKLFAQGSVQNRLSWKLKMKDRKAGFIENQLPGPNMRKRQ